MKYLVVKFYDNDFGVPMLRALGRLWEYIKHNNAAYTFRPNHLTVLQVFQKLLDCEALQPMILRLFILESLCQEVERKTRGPHHWGEWTKEEVQINLPHHLEPNNSLRCDVAIYGQYEVIPDIEWANGECSYLELETGVVGIF
jgi:hypothetical protein